MSDRFCAGCRGAVDLKLLTKMTCEDRQIRILIRQLLTPSDSPVSRFIISSCEHNIISTAISLRAFFRFRCSAIFESPHTCPYRVHPAPRPSQSLKSSYTAATCSCWIDDVRRRSLDWDSGARQDSRWAHRRAENSGFN